MSYNHETLTKKLIVGASIKFGEEYAKDGLYEFKAGETFTLVKGFFDADNGLYTYTESAPSIWIEEDKEFYSIYHLFGNDFEYFFDCEILPADGLVELTCMFCKETFLGPEPKMCCNGDMCGCGGMPIDPIMCSEDCYNSKFE